MACKISWCDLLLYKPQQQHTRCHSDCHTPFPWSESGGHHCCKPGALKSEDPHLLQALLITHFQERQLLVLGLQTSAVIVTTCEYIARQRKTDFCQERSRCNHCCPSTSWQPCCLCPFGWAPTIPWKLSSSDKGLISLTPSCWPC